MDLAPEYIEAISSYRDRKYPSIRATARAYSLSTTTFSRYLREGLTRRLSHAAEQYLSPTEEDILIRYILRLDSFGSPISLAFTRKLAYEICLS